MTRIRSLVKRFHATRDARLTRDLALVVARFALAWIFIFHGASTLFGAFGGAGLHAEAVYFSQSAHLHPGTFFALMAGIIECFGGIAVGIGVFGRLAAAAIVGDMVMAMITVTYAQGIVGNSSGIGYQLNVALAALAAVVAFMGTGRFSLDAFIRSTLKR
ncbi:MAG: DoxX family protein [Acidimicrobiales bacterium]